MTFELLEGLPWVRACRADAVEFRRVEYDVEAAARAIDASALPSELAAQLREARGYR